MALEFVDGHLLKCADKAVARVVHDNIDAPKGLDGRGDSLLRLHGRLHVELHSPQALAMDFAEISELFRSSRRRDHVMPRFKSSFGEGTTETA